MSQTVKSPPKLDLTADYEPEGKSRRLVQITAKLGSTWVLSTKIDPTLETARKAFITKFVRDWTSYYPRRALPPDILAELDKQLQDVAISAIPPEALIDPPRIKTIGSVRPFLFFTAWVSGLCVIRSNPRGMDAILQLHLQFADGRRRAHKIREKLRLPSHQALAITPHWVPPDTPESTWSIESRRAWLGGKNDPGPADVFRRLVRAITDYIDFGDLQSDIPSALALWVLLTYTFTAWNAVPYLAIVGPRESGKSRLLALLARLCFRPLTASGASGVALLHVLNRHAGTLLLDQAEGLRDGGVNSREIHHRLLSGYRRGATAASMDLYGNQSLFDIFGPRALASMGPLPPALARRCIPIPMKPAPPTSPCPGRVMEAQPQRFAALVDDLHALTLIHGQTWQTLARPPEPPPPEAPPEAPPEPLPAEAPPAEVRSLPDPQSAIRNPQFLTPPPPAKGTNWRQQELWPPLLALAGWMQSNGIEGLVEKMTAYAQHANALPDQEEQPDVSEVLLRALAQRVMAGEAPTPAELLGAAKAEDPEAARALHGSPRAVAVVLGRYGLTSTNGSGHRRFRVDMDDLRRVQKTYGVNLEICATADEICVAS